MEKQIDFWKHSKIEILVDNSKFLLMRKDSSLVKTRASTDSGDNFSAWGQCQDQTNAIHILNFPA